MNVENRISASALQKKAEEHAKNMDAGLLIKAEDYCFALYSNIKQLVVNNPFKTNHTAVVDLDVVNLLEHEFEKNGFKFFKYHHASGEVKCKIEIRWGKH